MSRATRSRKRAVGGRQRPGSSDRARWPAGEPRAHVRTCRLLAAERASQARFRGRSTGSSSLVSVLDGMDGRARRAGRPAPAATSRQVRAASHRGCGGVPRRKRPRRHGPRSSRATDRRPRMRHSATPSMHGARAGHYDRRDPLRACLTGGRQAPHRLGRHGDVLPAGIRLGHRDRGAPGRGRQLEQRLVGVGAHAGLAVPGAERRRLRPLPSLSATTSICSPVSASTPIGSRSSGAASSPRTASSRAPRSTTTGACAPPAASAASSPSSPSITSRRRAGWRRAAAGPSRRPPSASRASARAPPPTSATSSAASAR